MKLNDMGLDEMRLNYIGLNEMRLNDMGLDEMTFLCVTKSVRYLSLLKLVSSKNLKKHLRCVIIRFNGVKGSHAHTCMI